MATNDTNYRFIHNKIQNMMTTYPSLRKKPEQYAFSALAIKSNLYKNPALELSDSSLSEMIVDGANDGGVDAILTDPNSETNDLVLVQSKFYQSVTYEDIHNAINKLKS